MEEINNTPNIQNDVFWKDVIGKPVEYTPEYHTHDEYAKRYHKHTVADIIGLDGATYNGNVPEHYHDDRYYTKEQVDDLVKNNNTDVDMSSYAKKEYVDSELKKKSDIDHKHEITDFDGLETFADFYKRYEISQSKLIQDSDGFYIGHVEHNLKTTSIDAIVKDRFENELIADVSTRDSNSVTVLTDELEDLIVYIKKLNITK